jgi:hypothetical protein
MLHCGAINRKAIFAFTDLASLCGFSAYFYESFATSTALWP